MFSGSLRTIPLRLSMERLRDCGLERKCIRIEPEVLVRHLKGGLDILGTWVDQRQERCSVGEMYVQLSEPQIRW